MFSFAFTCTKERNFLPIFERFALLQHTQCRKSQERNIKKVFLLSSENEFLVEIENLSQLQCSMAPGGS